MKPEIESGDAVARLLRSLEEQLADPATRSSAARLSVLLADDLCEIGSSGVVYKSKSEIIALLSEESPAAITLSDFTCQLLTPSIALLTYRSQKEAVDGSPGVAALRSSIWIHRDGRWQLRFHQGTRTSRRTKVPRAFPESAHPRSHHPLHWLHPTRERFHG